MEFHGKCKQNTAFPVSNRVGSKQTRFEALVYVLSADLYRYAFWLCRDRGHAEELVQETFLRAWRSLDALRDDKAAKGWLITILRREHARWYERYRPEIEHGLEPDDLAGKSDSAPAEALAVRRTIADLGADYREPLLLQVLGGYTCEEIANFLGLSKGAVMTRLFRARQKLRSALESENDATVNHQSQL
jgi:RNA polymerase sigma-70 factor (ECF subfamily)